MKNKKRFALLVSVFFSLFLIVELFFNDALLFLSGGIIAGSIKNFLSVDSYFLIFLIWSILLLGFVLLFIKLKYKWLKIIILISIAFLLGIIDNVFGAIPVFDLENKTYAIILSNLILIIEISLKSLILAWLSLTLEKTSN